MTTRIPRSGKPGPILAISVGLSLLLCLLPAAGATFNVLVNGQGVRLPEPPVERGGRVFVPLRGIFESLGAGVVYDKGTINATAGDKTVQVKIGSNQAIVNGQSQYLDAAPFVVGASTMVPLRFVSEALGASVNYNDKTGTIAIETAQAQAQSTIPSGAGLTAVTNLDLNSGSAYVGQPVSMTVQPPYPAQGTGLAGAIIYGRVIEAQAAGQGRNAKLELGVDHIKLAGSGTQIPMAAKISKIDVRQGSNIGKEAVGTAAGMLIGNWIGKSLGTNAGGLVGAAGGYMLTSNSKTNFDVPTGSKVTMALTQPLALK
jgi:hypothetical protein